ncbi:MAG: J domain-containing protein [Deltaproteobacteria bacterium]|nr:J domain-containing protein [Deltaproteobacteria bacterium]
MSKMLMGMQKGAASAMQQELKAIQDELLKGTFDPSRIAEFAKKMGIDMSQLSGMMSQQAGFDPYRVLGLDRTASDGEVRKRYYDLLKKLHPDTCGFEGTNFLVQLIVTAYEMIKRQRGW